jgi:signal transduction histidine kinase
LFEDVKYSLESLIQKYSPIITTDFSVHEIYFSRKNLRSLFYNILSNAIKYSSPDRVNEITIATKAEGNYTVLSIADKGLGMSEGYENKIFRMFKRLHDHVEGSGVGLYLVKRIIENSGGKIEVESALGKGSCFRLFFRKNPGKA